jgi:phosphoinositide-3-kinase regulatory subunit 4
MLWSLTDSHELSFSSRLSLEADTEKNLKTVGNIGLQKLGVVPQTVFLQARTLDPAYSARIMSPHSHSRRSIDMSSRTPMTPPIQGNRMITTDHATSGAPFEDLRRRLAAINASTSSLAPTNNSRDPRSQSPMISGPPVSAGLNPVPDRPSSPTESNVSASNSSSFRAAYRLQVGSTDGQKAAPAIGSTKANATGLFEAPSKMRQDGSPEHSGRSSPISVAGTLRGAHRPRVPPMLPISTYG